MNTSITVCWRCQEKFQARKSQCPSCLAWQTPGQKEKTAGPIRLSDVKTEKLKVRIATGPWDKCFGAHPCKHGEEPQYGIVLTSVTLIAGAPGAGKSTLSLQATCAIAKALNSRITQVGNTSIIVDTNQTPRDILYICTEQSPEEIKMYAERMDLSEFEHIVLIPMGTDFRMSMLADLRPAAVVLDSLSGLTSNFDEQVIVCQLLKTYAVKNDCPVIIITHTTKDSDYSGKMDAQHGVDTTMTLYPKGEGKPCKYCDDDDCEGCRRQLFTDKNRWGKAQISIDLQITEQGLIALEVEDDE